MRNIQTFVFSVFTFSIIFVCSFAKSAAAEASGKTYKYLGAGSCASSNCHGSVQAKKGTNILRNEYVTWYKEEAHSRAYKVLLNKDSKRIAKLLGIGPAHKAKLCLDCHATYVPKSARGRKFRIEDGVGCESCHGPSEGWIKSHTAKGATHADSVRRGMFEIVPLKSRTTMCLSCHLGTDEKTVDHRLIGAGHPRLTFELDFFSLLQPNHWEVDDDYVKRKTNYNSTRAWLIGQAVRSSELLKLLLSKKRSRVGAMPELTAFYCYSCHHSLVEDQWKSRSYGGRPGELRLNLSSLLMVSAALRALNPSLANSFDAQIKDTHKAYYNGNADAIFASLQKKLDGEVYQLFKSTKLTKETTKKILKEVARYSANTPSLQYEVAEQCYMAMASIVDSFDPDNNTYLKRLDAIYATIDGPKKEEEFKPASFTKASKAFLSVLK